MGRRRLSMHLLHLNFTQCIITRIHTRTRTHMRIIHTTLHNNSSSNSRTHIPTQRFRFLLNRRRK
jgi:hypothetical protein